MKYLTWRSRLLLLALLGLLLYLSAPDGQPIEEHRVRVWREMGGER